MLVLNSLYQNEDMFNRTIHILYKQNGIITTWKCFLHYLCDGVPRVTNGLLSQMACDVELHWFVVRAICWTNSEVVVKLRCHYVHMTSLCWYCDGCTSSVQSFFCPSELQIRHKIMTAYIQVTKKQSLRQEIPWLNMTFSQIFVILGLKSLVFKTDTWHKTLSTSKFRQPIEDWWCTYESMNKSLQIQVTAFCLILYIHHLSQCRRILNETFLEQTVYLYLKIWSAVLYRSQWSNNRHGCPFSCCNVAQHMGDYSIETS